MKKYILQWVTITFLSGFLGIVNSHAQNIELNKTGNHNLQSSKNSRSQNDTIFIFKENCDTIGKILGEKYPDLVIAKMLIATKKGTSLLEFTGNSPSIFTRYLKEIQKGDKIVITDIMILDPKDKKKKRKPGNLMFVIK